jgi:hypothetical protein
MACSSIKEVHIETYVPAEITFPSSVSRVIIANNAVLQPDDFGHTIQEYNKKEQSHTMSTDSVMFEACQSLAHSIHQQKFFKKVLISTPPIRHDDSYHTDIKLTKEEVNAICNRSAADAVISIDRLLFNGKKNILSHNGYLWGTQRVDATAIIRAYLPNRENSLATILITDSIEWIESASNAIELEKYMPTANHALRAAAAQLSAKVYRNFVPHWNAAQRKYYSSKSSRWKEATAFASKEKWDEAKERWHLLFKQTTKPLIKARLANNIALSYEMLGDFEQAYQWILQAETLYLQQPNNKNKDEAAQASLYKETISDRIRSEKKLNMQIK